MPLNRLDALRAARNAALAQSEREPGLIMADHGSRA
jgi:hypothetical protein